MVTAVPPPLPDVPDEGDDAAVIELVPMLRRVIGARVKDPHTVEDLVQEALARVMSARDRIQPDKLAQYASVTARNLVATLAEQRDRQRDRAHLLVEPDDAQPRVEPGAPGGAPLVGRTLVDREGVDLGAAVVVDEQLRLEGGLQLLQQRVVHRRAGEAELAHAVGVGARERWVRQQVVVQRRHEVEVRHLLVADHLEGAPGVEPNLGRDVCSGKCWRSG